MAGTWTMGEVPVDTATESMRRFSLKPRKSSYSSAPSSSATNESNSTSSSRPSIPDAGRRRSSLASFSSRLRRAKRHDVKEIREQDVDAHGTSVSLGQRFCELPAEIQTAVLTYLPPGELLSLRLVSKQCLAIMQSNASTIARNAFLPCANDNGDNPSMYFLIELYPSLFSSTSTDAYFLRCLRRDALIRRQLHVLLTFLQTRVYMLKLTRNLDCEYFGPYRNGLYKRLYQPLGYIQHYLETIRHLVVHNHTSHLSPRLTINDCPTCMEILLATIDSYPQNLLVPIHQTMQLLLQHFRAATRTPSNVSSFERKWRGWAYGPPPEEHMAQLVLFGGLQELAKINEMHGSYAKRINVVKQYADTVSEAVRVNSIAFPDFYQTETDPVMAMAGEGPSRTKAKGKQIIAKPVQKDKDDVRTAIEGSADAQSTMKSLDVRLDLLTEQTIKSIPHLDSFLVGSNALLGKKIMTLNLVDDVRELISPYGFVQSLLVESYEPEVGDSSNTSRPDLA